jgi:hypothetical protein
MNAKKNFLLTLTVLLLLSITACDPGWHLMLREPASPLIDGKQIINVNDLTIRTSAFFFSLGSNINLEITIKKDKTLIVPQFAHVASLVNSNKTRIPYDVTLIVTREGKQISEQIYSIKHPTENKTRKLTLKDWGKNNLRIHLAEFKGNKRITKIISEKEYLSPVLLQKGDILKVHFRFLGFSSCSKKFGFDPPCQDITMYYNISNNNRPLKLTYISKKKE